MTQSQLDALGEEIATFAARIDIAEHALLSRLRVFDAHEAWGEGGFCSCAHWLSWRIGIGLKAAREKVRVARALGTLTQIDAAFGRGELSYSKVRAITRVATPASEREFLDAAIHATASQIERLTRAYRRVDVASAVTGGATVPGGDPREQLRQQQRFVRRFETMGGMVRIEMQLPPEEAALVWEAMIAAGERGEQAEQAEQADEEASAEASAPVPSVTTATAPATAPANDAVELEQQRADAIVDVAQAYLQHRPRTLGSSYELVVVTTASQLEHGHGGAGGYLRDGTPVPLHVARMLACDGARVDVVLGEDGELLDVGRRTRAIPSAIARGLWLRDGGCRFPGCGRKRHLHAHHVQAWADGGPTRLSNLVLVCSSHHRMIHERKLSTRVEDGRVLFVDRRGRDVALVPPASPMAGARTAAGRGGELEELERFLREADAFVDPSVGMPKWDGRPMDLHDTLSWMFIAEQTRSCA